MKNALYKKAKFVPHENILQDLKTSGNTEYLEHLELSWNNLKQQQPYKRILQVTYRYRAILDIL